jgi:hypothetical protein
MSKKDKGPLWLNKCKPSKAASKDQTRPRLLSAAVVEDGGERFLLATNSYILARIPVDPDTPKVVIAPEALKRIERGDVHEVTDDGAITFKDLTGSVTVQPSEPAPFERMPVEFNEGDQTVTIGLNPELLWNLAQALGGRHHGVRVTINVADGTTLRAMKVEPFADNGPNGKKPYGLLMPIRVSL